MIPKLEFLLCSPEHFQIQYVINPWMVGKEKSTTATLARSQWEEFFALIARHAKVHLLKPAPGLPDLVFVANAAVVFKKRAVIARFKPKERQGEEAIYEKWFKDHGYEVLTLETGMFFEGAGDALFDRRSEYSNGLLWMAYGQRTLKESHQIVADFLGVEFLSLELVDPRFYHIDTCFCPLSGGHLIYYPKAFSKASQELIQREYPATQRHELSDEDACQFAGNSVDLNSAVLMAKASEELKKKLQSWGFEVYQTDLSEFLKAGGSAKCLSLKLSEPIL